MSTNSSSVDEKKKWCVMVYFAADIDLEPAAMADLEQMKAAGSSSQVDLLAQVNPGGARPIRRYHLQKDTYLQEDLIPSIHPDGEHFLSNVSARKDLIDFVAWCASQSQAEHYALILWGHGQGWKADNPDPCFVPGAGNPRKPLVQRIRELPSTSIPIMDTMPSSMPITLLNGETDFLSNNDLRVAVAEAKKILGKNIDILGMDACLMAMGEICCQVDESVDFLIACEDTVPDESWPYDSILKLLVANADRMTAEDFARVIVWKFVFDFGQKRKFVTQSICRLADDKGAALNNFTVAMSQLVETLLVEIKDPETRWAAMVARSHVQSFYMRDYVDIYDYCRLLSINCRNTAVSSACERVMTALHDSSSANNGSSPTGLVVDHGTYGYPLKCSFGLSVFFPCVGQVPSCYAELEFSKRTKWHEFLNAFLTSPEGKTAVFERLPQITTETKPETDGEWPNVIPDEQPAAAPVSPTQPVAVVANAPATVATAAAVPTASLTATGVVVMSNDAPAGNGLKTTYGDVIKTSHGDPIKRPQLPVWMLPNAPKVTSSTLGPTDKPGDCNCGKQHY